MPSLPSATDLKAYLGLTTTSDDALIAERVQTAIGMAERDTGRVFASSSNKTRLYSSNGESLVSVSDRPMTDASRVVTWMGAALVEGSTCWFLPDRRDPDTTTSLQIKPFQTVGQWWRADPAWFDKNLDRRAYPAGMPNDLSITGIEGIPFPRSEVTGAILVLGAFLYWRAKSGASGVAYATTGEAVSLEETPPEYQAFVRDWKVYPAVAFGG